jgi:hypothetical protein
VLAACIATLAGVAMAARPAQACDNRYPWTCEPIAVAAPEVAAPVAQPARSRPPAARGKAHKPTASQRTPRQTERAGRRTVPLSARAELPRAKPGKANDTAPPAVVEEDARHDGGKAAPAAGDAQQSLPLTVPPDDEPEVVVTDRTAAAIVIVSHAELNEIDRAARALPQATDQTWLARLLAAIGAAFAAASVLRFLAG